MPASMMYFRVHGLDCAEEVALLKREVGPAVGGADRLSFDLLNGKMGVPGVDVSPDTVIRAVANAGLRAEVWDKFQVAKARGGFWERSGRTVLTTASGLLGLAGFTTHAWIEGSIQAALGSEGMGLSHTVPLPAIALYLAGILAGVWAVLPKAWLAIKRIRPDMNFLMTIAVIGAAVIGEWFEAATVSFLFSLSLALESWSVNRARRAVEALLDLTPPTARLLEAGEERELRAEEVSVGSLILVKPGERLPLDGLVEQGASQVNQAPITGESVPVPKAAGDPVFAGTINGEGALEIRTTKPAADTTLAHIIRMVSEAQSRRAASEQWVERFAQMYTPAVLSLALLVLTVPTFLFQEPFQEWFYRALVLLVIACPCALVISTPVSIVAGLAAAARHGVLIKGGIHLETPARLRAIAFDKTGTLTEGNPAVAEVVTWGENSEARLLELAASLESRSEHPLAQAVLAYSKEQRIALRPVEDFQIVPGKGATGKVEGRRLWLGSHRFLEERGQETSELHQRLEAMSGAGKTVVIVGDEDQVFGFIGIADQVRAASAAAVHALRLAGIKHIAMLTGDNKATAQAVGQATGVDEVRAELLPAEKVAAVEDLVARHKVVAMVGDGVNDAPALALANLGIAMGAAGSDAAIETADIALMSDDLSKLAWLVHHSRRTLAVIRQNIFFSLSVKAAFVALTFLGFASLWTAIAADMGASFLVIANGLRLLKG